MLIGYNTNGMAHHDPFDALDLLVKTGYQSVAITIDHGWLSPRDPQGQIQIQRVNHFLKSHGLASVIETGARFLLDPQQKHAPTLLDPDHRRVQVRLDFLKYCIDVGVELGSDCVSLWSGVKPAQASFNAALDQLARNLAIVLEYAEDRGIDIGFEPEPGMLIDSTGRFERMIHLVDSPRLKMTMDIGHLFCLSEVPLANYIEKWRDHLVNVHIEDMQAGVHEHLMFGEGQIYFPPVIESLLSVGYTKGLHIELSRHSHMAAQTVRNAFDFLNPIIQDAKAGKEFDY